MTLWRLTTARYAETAFAGEGARLYGGRWNSPGRAVVYLAGSLALAALEILVHVKSHDELGKYVKIRVEASEGLASGVEALPENWQQGRASDETRSLGDRWLEVRETPLLRVPSVVIPEEHNYLLNPQHAGFRELTIGEAEPFSFDPRLRGG